MNRRNGNLPLTNVNYLAHFYLAYPEENLTFGNYIGDGVKGSDFSKYPDSIARGIRFHRFIDTYTDSHQEVIGAKGLYYETQSKFSGVVVDVMFDHLLALRWAEFHSSELAAFANDCYRIIHERYAYLPKRSERFYQYMVSNNILPNYATIEGIERVFRGMDSRTKYASNMLDAVNISDDLFQQLDDHFKQFFPDLIQACKEWKIDH